MLKSLFKAKNPLKRQEERIRAIEAMNISDAEKEREWFSIVLNETDQALRQVALSKISDASMLQELKAQVTDPDIQRLITNKIVKHPPSAPQNAVDSNAAAIDEEVAKVLLLDNADASEAALMALNDEQRHAVVLAHSVLAVKCLAVQKIDNEAILSELQKVFKSKNKTVFRAIREKQKQRKDISLRAQQWLDSYRVLVERLKAISQAAINPQLPLDLLALEKKWQNLQADAKQEQRAEIAHLLGLANAYIQANKAQLDDILTEAQARAEQSKVIIEINELHQTVNQDSDYEKLNLKENCSELLKRWERAAKFCDTTAEQSYEFSNAFSSIESLQLALIRFNKVQDKLVGFEAKTVTELMASEQRRIAKTIAELRWPEEFKKPELLTVLISKLDDAQAQAAEHAKAEEAMVKEVLKLKRIIESQIQKGILRPADRLYEKLMVKFAELPKKRQQRLEKGLEKLKAKIETLKDWKGFVVEPKKDQLIADMEKLVDFSGDVLERAERIKALQHQWRSLNYGDQDGDEDVKKFRSLADQAFEPCAKHFEQKKSEREQNLIHRQKICDELRGFCNEVQPKNITWETVSDIKKQAKADWKKYSPIEHTKLKEINKLFNGILDQVDELFDRIVADIVDEKNALVEQAKKIAQLESNHEAVEQAKRLQTKWNDIKKLPYKREKELWKSFRENIDMVFTQRSQLREDRKVIEAKITDQAKAVFEQLQAILQDPELLGRQQEVEALKSEYFALEALPKNKKAKLHEQFKKIVTDIEAQKHSLLNDRQQQQKNSFYQLISELVSYDKAYVAGQQTEFLGLEPERHEALPNRLQQCLVKREQATKALIALPVDQHAKYLDDNFERKAQLCLECEIITGAESPDAYKQIRMERQVALMSNRMMEAKQSSDNVIAKVAALELEFKTLGLARDEDTLEARFAAALKCGLSS